MKTFDTICSRKSVRSYTGENITEEELTKILKAGDASPVGLGQYENMHITIIKDKELLKEIDETGARMFGKTDMHLLYGVCKVFVLCDIIDGEFIKNIETTEIKYFSLDNLPNNLAEEKTNKEQIEMCFEAYKDKNWQVQFD